MTERKEFELVAKAAGYEYASNKGDVHWIKTEFGLVHWMPKTDDGDSHRLQVDLHINVYFANSFSDSKGVCIYYGDDRFAVDTIYLRRDRTDKYAAVREAVWDVAVEVAKQRMEK